MSRRSDDDGVAAWLPIIGGIAVGAGILALVYKMFFSGAKSSKKQCLVGRPKTWNAPTRKPTKCEQKKRKEED